MDISKFEKIDTFDDVIYDIGNRYIHIDISIFLAKNGHIDMDISIYRYRYVHFRYIHIDMSIFGQKIDIDISICPFLAMDISKIRYGHIDFRYIHSYKMDISIWIYRKWTYRFFYCLLNLT